MSIAVLDVVLYREIIVSVGNTVVFFFNDTATTEIYTLSLHDALPISHNYFHNRSERMGQTKSLDLPDPGSDSASGRTKRSEEHTSELQSLTNLVCRLLLEKKIPEP